MTELEPRMRQLLQEYRATAGGRLEDYFGTAYLEAHHRLAQEAALAQTGRGNSDYEWGQGRLGRPTRAKTPRKLVPLS